MRSISKHQVLFLVYIVLFLLVITSPFWLWQLKKTKPLDVLVIDKTVSEKSYREHRGLMWLLNNEKYVMNDKSYNYAKDYSGFKPGDGEYKVSPLPENLDDYDLIYLADQYGVYEDEFYTNQSKKGNSLLYGGLTDKEISRLEEALLGKKKTLIAEFNTFASPTDEQARERMANLLGLEWSGWIGRYFNDLEADEVPLWVKRNYKEQTGRKWTKKGKGFLYVHSDGKILVLDEKAITSDNGLSFSLTNKGRSLTGKNVKSRYGYWFDVVQAKPGTSVLAAYKLPVTSSARKMLSAYNLPVEFPAILHQENAKYNSYYFAGDFADEKEIPEIYQTRGVTAWKEHFGARHSFYWNAYVPIMKEVLDKGLKKTVKQQKAEVASENGLEYNSKTGAANIQIMKNGKWENLLIKGVNMGIAKPGYFPGETAISKQEYFRWFEQIAQMNANAIRVYTLHPPAFYEAFYEYNQRAKKPLYLLHGVWIEEEKLVKTKNMFAGGQPEEFKENIKQIIDAVHGSADIPKRTGHASGTYKWDISPYILGYILGIEWDPEAVHETNQKNKDIPQFKGKYFSTKQGNPFEIWMSQMMDFTATYEQDRYNWQHSMSFTNWVTTDLLTHPSEPSENEDLVSADPNHIVKETGFKAGMFASYHIYPYYPDFLNYEDKYVNYKDEQGRKNNYEGYLQDLIKHHTLPVLVAEFGVPGSRGLTHKNIHGMDQGNHSEQEQGKWDQMLFRSIVNTGYAGGLVFTWQDEWFKRTWNTMDYDNPDRRPFWNNVQTNEQHFGLLSFDPGKEGESVYVDGDPSDWYRLKDKATIVEPQKGDIKQIRIHSDEGYIYMRADFKQPLKLDSKNLYFLFDTIEGQGKKKIDLGEDTLHSLTGVDFLAEIKGKEDSHLLIDSYYDSFYFQYAHLLNMIPKASYANKKNNEIFHPIRLALNKSLTIPDKKLRVPFQSYETGKLTFGNSNPESKKFNSLADINVSSDRRMAELRIPWALLNIKDPSSKEAMADLWTGGLTASKQIKGIHLNVFTTDKKGKLLGDMTPEDIAGSFIPYSWENWEFPAYHERLKESYYMMKKAYSDK
ncbi:hypothetical protein [Peribacillus deserti]|uniref:Uncharacterized protein n=1 Tax=Peribacillus deserti TaxID=673318 RepID=A0A2N5M022_9BACI|nr:hypothetical protein [Peribacillus deserti]PLT27665.1 hypothetical protein CUU66_22690 [Peribacillus deserti]